MVVVAAGNLGRDGYATITSPGNEPLCDHGRRDEDGGNSADAATISSPATARRGPPGSTYEVKPDIVAPGNLVSSLLAPGSTLAQEYPQNIVPASAYMDRGTPGRPNISS